MAKRTTNPKDYIRNLDASRNLAHTIKDYYRARGHVNVKVWVEEEEKFSDFGTKLPSNYYIRSNILYNVASIPKGVLG